MLIDGGSTSKKNIAEYAKENPQYANDIMEIVNSYGCADL